MTGFYLRFVRAIFPVGCSSDFPSLELNRRITESQQSFQLERIQIQRFLEVFHCLGIFLSEIVVQTYKKSWRHDKTKFNTSLYV